MNRVQTELIPAIGRSLIELGVSAVFGGAHGLRRLAEGFVWGDQPCAGQHDRGPCGACPQVQHHYRYHCQPRCYDCHR